MKIVIPELNNPIIKKAIEAFPHIEFLPANNPMHAVDKLVAGDADSIISGLDYSSREVLLAFKAKIPLSSPFFSSCFICKKDSQTLAIADGGVIKHPNKEQLYTIIEDTATTFQSFANQQPKIALLSYSTNGSGVKDKTEFQNYAYCIQKITERHKDWLIDGEIQLDAAIDSKVAEKKAPHSPLKGQANILITPDINSGNILYKSLERFGRFTVAGPIVQGFTKPLADLSRGSTVDDVILTLHVLETQLK